jgi:hypothetical protein
MKRPARCLQALMWSRGHGLWWVLSRVHGEEFLVTSRLPYIFWRLRLEGHHPRCVPSREACAHGPFRTHQCRLIPLMHEPRDGWQIWRGAPARPHWGIGGSASAESAAASTDRCPPGGET